MTRPHHPRVADQPTPATPTRMVATSQAKHSIAERKSHNEGSPTPHLVEGDRLMRNIDRPPPGDVVRRAHKTLSIPELTKRRSKIDFFDGAFSVNDSSSARERVHGDAIVTAEVKTNVIVCIRFPRAWH